MYNDGTPAKRIEFQKHLTHCLPSDDNNNSFFIKIANFTTHGLARIFQRGMSKNQQEFLQNLAKNNKTAKFDVSHVSEIRGVQTDANDFVITGLVIDDVVCAVDPKNLTAELRQMGYGTREGAGYGVIKTALARPNTPQKFAQIEGYQIVDQITA